MRHLALAVLLASFGGLAVAADPVFTADGVAIRGYDPVAYHRLQQPVAGKPEFSHRWNEAEWHFVDAANRDAFAKDPLKYAPAFGGYCAFGASRGYKVSTEPAAFAIVDGVLYLNYSQPVQNTWNTDRPGYIAKAKQEWLTLESEAYHTDAASVAKAKLKGK
jgi:hypothetical protein